MSDPTPQPAHDHGAAGFCTDHAQAPDERTETVARVLWDHAQGGKVNGVYRCCCGWCPPFGPSFRDAHSHHQAAAVVAALDDESARLRAELTVEERASEQWARKAGEHRAALDRVRAVPASPGDLTWLNLSRRSQAAYRSGWEAAGRECRLAALDPEEPR